MKDSLLEVLCCPIDKGSIVLKEAHRDESGEVLRGQLICENCSQSYEISGGVPRMISREHYSASFGWQWNKYAKTQLDSHSGHGITRKRKEQVCRWSNSAGGWGLEVGCGAGRFSEILSEEEMNWICLDSSSAVDANFSNNGHRSNIHIVQADLRQAPFKEHCFHRMICLGVLQHTPDPKTSFFNLLPFLTPKGEFAFDIYIRKWDSFLWSKYWLRPWTKKMDYEKLFHHLERWVPFLIRCHDILRLIPWVGRRMAHRLIPVCNYKYSYPFDRQQNIEWALLDTFDMLAPAHDHPASYNEVRDWLGEVDEVETELSKGPNGLIGMLKRGSL